MSRSMRPHYGLFFRHALIVGLSATALLGTARANAADPRPNILIIMADDMGYSDIGCYGGEIETPNLNRLAEGGLRFTQFYNTGRCCPTRASLLTGLYPHQAGVGHMMEDQGFDGYRGDLNANCVTIAQVLRTAGYATYMAGKWHVTKQTGYWSGRSDRMSRHNWPIQRGFDRFYGIIHGAGSFYNPPTLLRDNSPIQVPQGPYYFTDAVNDHAVQFIREHSTDDPFFVYVAHTAPHWPMHALPEDIVRYRGRYDEGWDALRKERFERMRRMGLVDSKWALTQRGNGIPAWEETEFQPWHREVMAVYAAMVDRMDQGIGRIVDELHRSGRLDNTLIFFLADNGGCAEGGRQFTQRGAAGGALHSPKFTRDGRLVRHGNYATVMPGGEDTYQEYGKPWANASNTPFREYKHWVHEGGISTPLVVHWPRGVPEDREGNFVRHPGHLIDLMATSVDVSGATYPSQFSETAVTPMQGVSLAPTFSGQALPERIIYFEHEGHRAVRQGPWKLVAKKGKPWELYNMLDDRSETQDLAANQSDRVHQLGRLWDEWAIQAKAVPGPWNSK